MKGLTNFTNSSEVSYGSGSVKDKLDSLSTSVADTVSRTNGGTFGGNIIVDRKNGTTSSVGYSVLAVGNDTPQGTSGNSTGFIRLFGNGGNVTHLIAPDSSEFREIKFPDKSGTAALTSDKIGTTSDLGNSILILGNATPEGSEGNVRGVVRMYGKGAHWGQFVDRDGLTADRVYYLPDKEGTLALTSDLETSYTKLGSVEKASALNTAVALPLGDSIDNYKYLWFCVSYYDSGVASYGGTMVQTKLAKLIYGQDAGIRVVCLSGTTYGDVAFRITSTTSMQCIAEANIIGRYYVVYGLN